jgi:hypothetical protein
MEGLSKITKNISQDSQYRGQDLNLVPLKYETGMLTTQPQCLMTVLEVSELKDVQKHKSCRLLWILFRNSHTLFRVKRIINYEKVLKQLLLLLKLGDIAVQLLSDDLLDIAIGWKEVVMFYFKVLS